MKKKSTKEGVVTTTNNNNIPSEVSQVKFGEGKLYADLNKKSLLDVKSYNILVPLFSINR